MKTKRIMALTMALCMLLALIPMLALQVVFPVRARAVTVTNAAELKLAWENGAGAAITLGASIDFDGVATIAHTDNRIYTTSEKFNLTVSGTVNSNSPSYGIILLGGGNLTITGTVNSGFIGVEDGGNLLIDGGIVKIGWNTSIYVDGDVEIKGNSDVLVNGVEGDSINAGGNISISDSKVDAGSAWTGLSSGGSVTIFNSTVDILGCDSNGIFANGDVNILSGNVNISAEEYGIYAEGNITIENGTLKINTTVDDLSSEGLYAWKTITIKGGRVEVTSTGEFQIAGMGQSVHILGGSGFFKSENFDYAVIAEPANTLFVAPGVTVWKHGDTSTLADIDTGDYVRLPGESGPEEAMYFVAAGTENPLSAIEFAAFTVKVENGTLQGGKTTDYFKPGDLIHITAGDPPEGQQFKEWTFTTSPTATLAFLKGTTKDDHDVEFTMPFAFVTATATFEPIPAGNHLITVNHIGNGVANANVPSAPAGATVTLTATADAGNKFLRWQVVSGDISLSSTTERIVTFVMPDTPVVVVAVFNADIPATGLEQTTLFSIMLITLGLACISAAVLGVKKLKSRS